MSEDEGCSCEGRCHGPMKWCARCGDVDIVCNFLGCNMHRCVACEKLLTREEHEFNIDWFKWCFSCHVATAAKVALYRGAKSSDVIVDEMAAALEAEDDIQRWRRSARRRT